MQNTELSTEKHPLKGMLLCLLAYFFVSLIGVLEKPIKSEVHIGTILFFQSFICLLLILPQATKHYRELHKLQHPNIYAVRILSGLACYGILFYLIRFIPIAEAFLYQYSASLWVPFIVFLWLGIRMKKELWWGILIGFTGIVLMLHPSTKMFGWVSLFGILCGILQAISVVAIRRLAVTEPLFRMLFYYFLAGTIITSFFMIKHWAPLNAKDLLFLCGVGVSTYLAQKLITLSLQYAHATTLAPITYISILFSGFMGWLFWHEVPSKLSLIGMALVISGCLLTILISKQPKLSTAYQEESRSLISAKK